MLQQKFDIQSHRMMNEIFINLNMSQKVELSFYFLAFQESEQVHLSLFQRVYCAHESVQQFTFFRSLHHAYIDVLMRTAKLIF